MGQVGRWAFIAGLVIAIIAGLGFNQPWVAWVLALLGVIVGFLNISGAETQGFLLAAIGLIVAANAVGSLPFIGGYATSIIAYLIAFIGAAVVVVALKSLFATARS